MKEDKRCKYKNRIRLNEGFNTIYIRSEDKVVIKNEASIKNISMAEFVNYLVNEFIQRKKL